MKSFAILFVTLFLITACQPKEALSVAEETPKKKTVKEQNKETEKEVVLKPCTKEAKQCPNGKVVGRNPRKNCEFAPCEVPKTNKETVVCPTDVKECPDGSFMGRDHYNDCKFKDCPNSIQ